MCWFFKKRKKQKNEQKDSIAQEQRKAETKNIEVKSEEVKKVETTKQTEQTPKVIKKPEKPEEVKLKDQEKPEKRQAPRAKPKPKTVKYSGKYEVYPEAGNYKFRLKASNGEILAVSFPYSTQKGAISGIETFKRSVKTGVFEVYTDKNNYSQFVLMNSIGARIIIVGEFYNSSAQAESAIDSVKKFYNSEKIDTLEKIADSEVREELVEFEDVEENDKGKYELYNESGGYYLRLKANNAQVLFVSQGYSSKASAKSGLETIKKAIIDNRFTVGRDKQNRYQFNLYSSTYQLILTGETYPAKANCISAINSVRKFAQKAKLVEV
jgi:uncharacterized protein YegP (UPF0339 family)